MRKNLWDKLNDFPPIACRLLARTKSSGGGVRPMTVDEIAARSGLERMEVYSMSWLPSWDNVPFAKVRKFSEACGVVVSDRAVLRMQSAYIRRGAPFKYLKRSPEWESTFKPMIEAYVRSRLTRS